jgi:glucosamine--fructose-6-phosphate aminotransferase (isomerizing)
MASKKLFSEVRERGGDIMLLTDSEEDSVKAVSIPYVGCEECASLLSIIPIQLFAYYYSTGRGRNPDRPRNLSRYIGRF